jgi:hypothetical protein
MKEVLIFWVVLGIPMLLVIKWIAIRQQKQHDKWNKLSK